MDKYLKLINRNQPFDESMMSDFEYETVTDCSGETFVEKQTLKSFNELAKYLEETYGITVKIISAGRTVEHQKQIYENSRARKGFDYAGKHIAEPGHSEHHLGLALDIEVHLTKPKFIQKLIDKSKFIKRYFDTRERELGKTDEILHLVHNVLCHYGFILRYPENKQNITGYESNPYHIRYVGEKHAERIFESKITLDEYVRQFTYYEDPNPLSFI